MPVDKFGHYFVRKYNSEENAKRCLRMIGFTLDGNKIDMENKRIINVSLPLEELDAVNKAYVDSQLKEMNRVISEEIKGLRNDVKDLKDRMQPYITYLPQDTE